MITKDRHVTRWAPCAPQLLSKCVHARVLTKALCITVACFEVPGGASTEATRVQRSYMQISAQPLTSNGPNGGKRHKHRIRITLVHQCHKQHSALSVDGDVDRRHVHDKDDRLRVVGVAFTCTTIPLLCSYLPRVSKRHHTWLSNQQTSKHPPLHCLAIVLAATRTVSNFELQWDMNQNTHYSMFPEQHSCSHFCFESMQTSSPMCNETACIVSFLHSTENLEHSGFPNKLQVVYPPPKWQCNEWNDKGIHTQLLRPVLFQIPQSTC